MKTADDIAKEYLKEFDRYYLPEQIKELTESIESYAKEQAVEFLNWVIDTDEPRLIGKTDEGREHLGLTKSTYLFDEWMNQNSK